MVDNYKEVLNQRVDDLRESIIKTDVDKQKQFSVEINLTEHCNFKCEYCFEGHEKKRLKTNNLNDDPSKIIKVIYSMFDDTWFKSIFETINIVFWGGEPTLNCNLMKYIIDEFKNDDRISFMIYTNGSNIDNLIPIICEIDKEKVNIQISYDGNPIHNLRRIDKADNPTSMIAVAGMKTLFDNGFEFRIKSTVMPKDFKLMPEAWDDIYNLRKQFGSMIGYAPTIDYYNSNFEDIYLKDLETSLLEIAKKEYHIYNGKDHALLTWFSKNSKRTCGSGTTMCAIDVDGEVYLCHGAIYGGNQFPFNYSSINNKHLVYNIRKIRELLSDHIYDDECERCIATTCLRCNYAKYINSNKDTLVDKFYDFKCQKDLCKYYKLIGKINRAFMTTIGGII
jgi:uncharacterized protein